MPSEVCFRR